MKSSTTLRSVCRCLHLFLLPLLLVACDPWGEAIKIRDLQGTQHSSPLVGQEVVVRGVVTAALVGDEDRGFWLQDALDDGESSTSEGVYIDASSAPAEVSVGDVVRVRGMVEEWVREGREADLTRTTVQAMAVKVEETGQALPVPVVIGPQGRRVPTFIDNDGLERFEPEEDAVDFFESLEGMRVEVRDARVVGPTSRHGEIVVVSGDLPSLSSIHGGLVLRPEGDLPERLMLGAQLLNKRAPEVKVGDRLTAPVVGVLDYSFSNFKILASDFPPVEPAAAKDEPTLLVRGERQLTVASFNVLNLSARDLQEKFDRVAEVIHLQMADPDILALQEIQDDSGPEDDGAVDAGATLEALIAAIEKSGGPRYAFREISPEDGADGGRPGANIRVAYLFDPARVTFVDRGQGGPRDATQVEKGSEGARLSLSPGLIEPTHLAFENSRKPLAAEFRFRGRTLFLVNLHLSSKGGDEPGMGRYQPPRRHSEEVRVQQSTVVQGFVEQLLGFDPQARVVVLGDTNEHEFRAPIQSLAGTTLQNLIEQVPEKERYTFNYEGRSQVLDNVLVSPELVKKAAPEIDIVHVNADFPDGKRASDHDPIVVRLTFQ